MIVDRMMCYLYASIWPIKGVHYEIASFGQHLLKQFCTIDSHLNILGSIVLRVIIGVAISKRFFNSMEKILTVKDIEITDVSKALVG
jgi:hypothetical protein